MNEPITARMKATEAKREVAFRKNVYPRMIAKGTMKFDDATWRIRVMEEIMNDYELKAAQDEQEERQV